MISLTNARRSDVEIAGELRITVEGVRALRRSIEERSAAITRWVEREGDPFIQPVL